MWERLKCPNEYHCEQRWNRGNHTKRYWNNPDIRCFWYGWEVITEMARSSSLGRLLKWDPISFVNEMGCDWNGMWLKKKKKSQESI